MVGNYSLIIPYYRNVEMLKRHIQEWEKYPRAVQIILVDDGSPEPAEDVLLEHASPELIERVRLFRVDIDIPWNRGGARNLGATVADTTWIVHIDIDHLLPATAAAAIAEFDASVKRWYRFERFRVGTADETRRKDFRKNGIPDDVAFGKIHPHVDSYLVTKRAFWEIGGYDEDYSGCLGGGNPFLAALEAHQQCEMAPESLQLHVYTRSVVKDASDWALSRSPDEFSRRRRQKERDRNIIPKNPLRFPWHEVLMHYPKVKDEFQTLEQLKLGKSIARFGDGEMKLITGGAQIREPANKNLGRELKQVLNYPHENCIVGIPTMNPKGAKYQNWTKHAARFAKLLNPKMEYYSAFISRPDSAQWIATREYAQAMVDLWKDKAVTFVCERTSKFFTLVQQTARTPWHVECPHTQTYAVSEQIIRDAVASKPDIVLLSCGPAATVMANRLSEMGIQALDLGSMGGFILKQLGVDEDEPMETEP